MHSDSGVCSSVADCGSLHAAILEWRLALGEHAVQDAHAAMLRFGMDTCSQLRQIDAVITPDRQEQLSVLVKIARYHEITLYPISTGHNWGYGSAKPAVDHCVIVDLAKLKRIIAMDVELGLITIEPGVTQADLRAYLDQHKLPFLVPVTGAGPSCSLIGNALERGYGVTPVADHFQAVTSLEAILPNGDLYRSPLTATSKAGAPSQVFKWGIGPYLDGLFAQGNFGIVTQMTIALARRPQQVKAFYFWVEHDADLERVVVAVREVLQIVGSNVGGINLMSSARVLAMSVPYPEELAEKNAALSAATIDALAKQHGITAWTGVGSVYGSREHVKASCAVIRRLLAPHVKRIVFADRARVQLLQKLVRLLPAKFSANLPAMINKMAGGLDLMEGIPNEVALPLAYWKSGVTPPSSKLDPARDACGLLWYAPIIPMRAQAVRDYLTMVRSECARFGIEPAVTLTSLSERGFDSTLPILFKRDHSCQEARALQGYRALFAAGKALGFVPYRVASQFMDLVVDAEQTCWRMAQTMQQSIDPGGVMANGRYSLCGVKEQRATENKD
ncbi:FAD-binding oxidoreductase [Undibacterium crateris]|uniref:FAD-binding oxidoreductase n=1 Tax=Undibacterium crateris TaxID=2528175 RepID=UPI00138A1C34|nr:FAD-binding oxidoreductase [Undibacterium crateris]NDI86355.1 FAD-binding protein [Undibacterium crateris]